MSIDNMTVDELEQALREKKIHERETERKNLAEQFMQSGVIDFQTAVSKVDTVEELYRVANNFTSRFVRVRKILELPVGKKGRKSKK